MALHEKTEYSIREYGTGDEEEIVDLLRLVFKEWAKRDETAIDHWRWMYLDNPFGSHCTYVAERDGKIVAVGHDLYLNVKHGEEDIKTVFGTDVAVHPDHRRKGLYSKLRKARHTIRMKKSDFQYSYTTNPILLERRKRHQKEEQQYYPFPVACKYSWIKDVDLHLKIMKTKRRSLMKYGYGTQRFLNKIKNVLDNPAKADKSYFINVVDRFDDSSVSFWEKVAPHYNFIVKRDKNYLNWRYGDPRSGAYTILQVRDEDDLLGFIVTTIEMGNGYPTGYVIDLLTISRMNEVADVLVKAAVKKLDENGVNVIRTLLLKSHPYKNVFERNGFVDNKERLYIRYRKWPDSEESEIIKNSSPEEIHLVYSDLFVR
jgi:GNAT superfamily N-acetyltransferase